MGLLVAALAVVVGLLAVIFGTRGFPLSRSTSVDRRAQGIPRIPLPGLVIVRWARP